MSEAIIARGGRGRSGGNGGSGGVDLNDYTFTTEMITSNTIWPVPTDALNNEFYVRIFGAGGGGMPNSNYAAGGGGGWMNNDTLTLSPGSSILINIGAGGAYGSAGGTTVFGEYLSANGGSAATNGTGGSGGSGGGGMFTGGRGYQFGGGGGMCVGGNGGMWGGGGGATNVEYYFDYGNKINFSNYTVEEIWGTGAPSNNTRRAGVSTECGNGSITGAGAQGVNTINIVNSDMAGTAEGGSAVYINDRRYWSYYYSNMVGYAGGGGGGYGGTGGTGGTFDYLYYSRTEPVWGTLVGRYRYACGGGGGGYRSNGAPGSVGGGGGGYYGDTSGMGGGGYSQYGVGGGTTASAWTGGSAGLCIIQYYKKT